jgi:hypothetical protein
MFGYYISSKRRSYLPLETALHLIRFEGVRKIFFGLEFRCNFIIGNPCLKPIKQDGVTLNIIQFLDLLHPPVFTDAKTVHNVMVITIQTLFASCSKICIPQVINSIYYLFIGFPFD